MSSPLLLIDAGNTRLKWATAKSSRIVRVAGEIATKEADRAAIRALAKKYPRHNVVLASVVPKLLPLFRRFFARRLHVVTGKSPTLGLKFDYPKPAQLGADRLAAAVAVHVEKNWPAIVVSCGTATAFTVLDSEGRLCGGAIAPGLESQLSALIGSTAQLPKIKLGTPRRSLGRSTEEAIRGGVVINFQGGAKEILRRLRADLKAKRTHILLTGGNARFLIGVMDHRATLRPLLVFEGLRIIGTRAFPETL